MEDVVFFCGVSLTLKFSRSHPALLRQSFDMLRLTLVDRALSFQKVLFCLMNMFFNFAAKKITGLCCMRLFVILKASRSWSTMRTGCVLRAISQALGDHAHTLQMIYQLQKFAIGKERHKYLICRNSSLASNDTKRALRSQAMHFLEFGNVFNI